ncbi:hypothetical protein AcV5_005537 [Taiwanofungus camphoratus]|nr:hypothetical protein AcV5_005537 [Antrodia cinnamomea]
MSFLQRTLTSALAPNLSNDKELHRFLVAPVAAYRALRDCIRVFTTHGIQAIVLRCVLLLPNLDATVRTAIEQHLSGLRNNYLCDAPAQYPSGVSVAISVGLHTAGSRLEQPRTRHIPTGFFPLWTSSRPCFQVASCELSPTRSTPLLPIDKPFLGRPTPVFYLPDAHLGPVPTRPATPVLSVLQSGLGRQISALHLDSSRSAARKGHSGSSGDGSSTAADTSNNSKEVKVNSPPEQRLVIRIPPRDRRLVKISPSSSPNRISSPGEKIEPPHVCNLSSHSGARVFAERPPSGHCHAALPVFATDHTGSTPRGSQEDDTRKVSGSSRPPLVIKIRPRKCCSTTRTSDLPELSDHESDGEPDHGGENVGDSYSDDDCDEDGDSQEEFSDTEEPESPSVLYNAETSYTLQGQLGRGGYGCVLLAESEAGNLVAIKVTNKLRQYQSKTGRERLLAEMRIMCAATLCGVPFLMNLLSSWEDGENVYFVMPLFPDTLASRLRREKIPSPEAKLYCAELVDTVDYLHENRIMHRDIKSTNILIGPDGKVVVADFGCARLISPRRKGAFEKRKTFDPIGTPGYYAPEILARNVNGYSCRVDVWSLGLVMLEIIGGLHNPFYDVADAEDQLKLMEEEIRWDNLIPDEDARDLLSKMLSKDPSSRPLPRDIKSHPYFDGIDFEKVRKGEYPHSYKPVFNGPRSACTDMNLSGEVLRFEDADEVVKSQLAQGTPSDFLFDHCEEYCSLYGPVREFLHVAHDLEAAGA